MKEENRIYAHMNGPYIRLVLPDRGAVYLHRYIWEYHFGEIPDGYYIHHKDGNPINNDLDNLQPMKRGQHTQHHLSYGPGYDKKHIYRLRHRLRLRNKAREYARQRRSTAAGRKRYAETQRRYTARKQAAVA